MAPHATSFLLHYEILELRSQQTWLLGEKLSVWGKELVRGKCWRLGHSVLHSFLVKMSCKQARVS
jgi:hypothetical protein